MMSEKQPQTQEKHLTGDLFGKKPKYPYISPDFLHSIKNGRGLVFL